MFFVSTCKNIEVVARECQCDCAECQGYISESYYTVEQWGHCNLAREYTAREVGCRERHGFDRPPTPQGERTCCGRPPASQDQPGHGRRGERQPGSGQPPPPQD